MQSPSYEDGLADTSFPQRTYAAMIRLHDSYDMHSVFSPGFPGLLESIYVQERLTEKLMPDVFAAFVRDLNWRHECGLTACLISKTRKSI